MMVIEESRQEWSFLFVCIGLGILAELSFLHGRVGVSYLVFILGFYLVTFLRFKLSFNHRRIGLLLMSAIWVLSANFLFYDIYFFHSLNTLLIPILVFTHIVLITSPSTFKWGKPKFLSLLIVKYQEGISYVLKFVNTKLKAMFKHKSKETVQIYTRIFFGLVIGIPILFIISLLLMSADTVFQDVVLRLPNFILNMNLIDWAFRVGFILLAGFMFFGIFQVLKREPSIKEQGMQIIRWNDITAITILVMLSIVYLLFVIIQFAYFFSGQLIEGFTYAEYARKGFFELIIVLLINWTILISFLKFVSPSTKNLKVTLQLLYSVLIAMSGVMLISAYMRLSLYEAAYGFTLSRLLAHAFMIYLMVIFMYTLMRVWLEKIPLLHFYLIVGLIFYTGLNVVNLEQVIIDRNVERYEQTGKIDVYYLHYLSDAGTSRLIELYKQHPHIEDLEELLLAEQEYIRKHSTSSWQSFNFTRQKMMDQLTNLKLREDDY